MAIATVSWHWIKTHHIWWWRSKVQKERSMRNLGIEPRAPRRCGWQRRILPLNQLRFWLESADDIDIKKLWQQENVGMFSYSKQSQLRSRFRDYLFLIVFFFLNNLLSESISWMPLAHAMNQFSFSRNTLMTAPDLVESPWRLSQETLESLVGRPCLASGKAVR